MYKVDRNNGGKIAWPARHYWWEVVGYDVEADFITHSTTFEAEGHAALYLSLELRYLTPTPTGLRQTTQLRRYP